MEAENQVTSQPWTALLPVKANSGRENDSRSTTDVDYMTTECADVIGGTPIPTPLLLVFFYPAGGASAKVEGVHDLRVCYVLCGSTTLAG